MSPVPEKKEGMKQELLPKKARELIESPDAFLGIPEDKQKVLIEAAVLFVGALLLNEKKSDEEGKKQEETKKEEAETKTDTAEKAVAVEAVTEVKKEEINEKLVELKAKVTPKEPYLPKVEEKEKIEQGSVYYVGDSYMQGITNAANIPGGRKNVASGRPLLPKKEGKWSGGNDVESIALKVIRENKPKLLVLNGGLNDFYMNQRNPEGLAENIIGSYSKIINEANKNGVRLVIYDVPDIPLEHANEKGAKTGMDKVNSWLAKQAGVKTLDTDAVIGYKFGSDKTHTTRAGYKNLSEAVGVKNA